MTSASTAPHQLHRLTRWLRILLVASVVLPAAVFVAVAWERYGAALQGAERTAQRTVHILHEHALKIFETHELLIDQIAVHIEPLDWRDPGTAPDVSAYLQRLSEGKDHIASISVIGSDGVVRASSVTSLPGKAVPRSSFGITRYRSSLDRTFRGAIRIAVSPAYFTRFVRSIVLDSDHSAVLFAKDGEIVARDPPSRQDAPFPPTSKLMKSVANAPEGSFWDKSAIDGVERVHAYMKLGTYPFYVDFGVGKSAALKPLYQTLLFYGIVGGISSLILFAAILVALRRVEREEAALAQLRRAEAALHQSQKVEALGQLTGGVAHDFNNLLTTILGNLELAQRRSNDPAVLRLLQAAQEGGERGAKLTRQLLSFSRKQHLQPKVIDANPLIIGLSGMLQHTLGPHIQIEHRLAPDAWPLLADANMLELALLNLAVNARDAMPSGGQLALETTNVRLAAGEAPADVPRGDYVVIGVRDTGAGMTEDVLARAFEPFFTTKEIGKGTGLGLSQVYGAARQQGGTVTIESAVGHGTTVRLYLPRAAAGTGGAHAHGAGEQAEHRGGTIIVVDDDDQIRDFIARCLREIGYCVLEANGADAALRMLASEDVDLLISDAALPKTNGAELARLARRERPSLAVLFITGHADAPGIGGPDGDAVLPKPFKPSALSRKVAALLGTARKIEGHPQQALG